MLKQTKEENDVWKLKIRDSSLPRKLREFNKTKNIRASHTPQLPKFIKGNINGRQKMLRDRKISIESYNELKNLNKTFENNERDPINLKLPQFKKNQRKFSNEWLNIKIGDKSLDDKNKRRYCLFQQTIIAICLLN